MALTSWGLNSDNDIFLSKGNIATVNDGDALPQKIRNHLLTYFSEWFLDTSIGVPYFEVVFVKPIDLAAAESSIKREILKVDGVLRILAFQSNFDKPGRNLEITFTVEDIYGLHTNSTVNIGG